MKIVLEEVGYRVLTIEQLKEKYGNIGFKLDLEKEINLEEILADLGFIKMDMAGRSQYLHLELPNEDYFHIRLDWEESLDEVKGMDKNTYLEKFADKMIEQVSDYTEYSEVGYDNFMEEDKKWLLQRLIFTGLMMFGIKSNIERKRLKKDSKNIKLKSRKVKK